MTADMMNRTRPIVIAAFGAVQVLLLLAAHAESDPPPDMNPAPVGSSTTLADVNKKEPLRAAPSLASPDVGWVCFDAASWINPCHKGSQIVGAPECPSGPTKNKKLSPPRFRLGQGPWSELSPTRWRCVPLPIGVKVLVAIQDQADRTMIAPSCPTRRVDVSYNDFYGGLSAHCSRRRKVQQDEFLPDYQYQPPNAQGVPGSTAK